MMKDKTMGGSIRGAIRGVWHNRLRPGLWRAGRRTRPVAAAVKTAGVAAWFLSQRTHRKLAGRPHEHLLGRWSWYRRWHDYRFHHHAHAGAVVVVTAAIGINTGLFGLVFASDITQSWTFTNPGDYTLSDSSKTEVTGSNVRLKAQNYATDGNTKGLWHLDESSGSNAADSSGNGNDGTVSGGSFGVGSLNNGLTLNGSGQSATVADSPSLSLSQNNTIEGWTKFSGAFSAFSHDRRQPIADKGQYRLYYDNESGKLVYELANSSATTWTQQAGNDIKGSWDLNGKFAVVSQVAIGSDVYAGLGNAVGDAEVWRWNGSTWSQIGGDGKNSSWADQTYETVTSMAVNGSTLYAGLGNSTGDAEVWSCDTSTGCTDWTKIGGDGINGGWAINLFEDVTSMTVMGGNLYAGLGNTANDARVYRWNGTSWTWVGGFGIGLPYNAFTTGYEGVYSLTNDGTNVYAGFGNTAGDGDVWRLTGTTWTQIGGDALNSGWAGAVFEYAYALRYVGGTLYAGLGATAGDAEIWSWNGSAWTKVGGDTVNSSWDASSYENVYSLADDGTNLYVGLGNTAGDNEVWRWSGSAWTKIGGDGVNSGFTNTHIVAHSLVYAGSTLYAGLTGAAASGEVWSFNGTSWTRIGGNLINKSWGFFNVQSIENLTSWGGKLYAGTGSTVAGNATVWEFDGTSWTHIGGQGINGSWTAATYETVSSMVSMDGNLYASVGVTAGDAEVWRWNGTSWTQVGGDTLFTSWANATYEQIWSMAEINSQLYVGLGSSANDAEVWRCTGCGGGTPSWTKIGGDSLNSGWTINFETVNSMAVIGTDLYVGLGASATDAEVWRWNGSAWNRIGGDGVNSSWNTNYETVESLMVYQGNLYAGLGNSTDDAEIWRWNGSSWSQVGGDDLNSSWTAGTYERVRSTAVYNGALFVGLGTTAGDGEVWRYDGTTWTQVGGDAQNSSWAVNTIENVPAMSVYQGKLYVGTGDTANLDAAVWSYGNNGYLASTVTGQDTGWHHVAATYDGATMKLFVDGVAAGTQSVSLSIPDTTMPLYLGANAGPVDAGEGQGFFAGSLDEIRISDVARTTFTTLPYANTPQTVTTAAVYPSGIASWDTFSSNEAANGGTVTYRLSDDNGASWKYWTGAVWGISTTLSDANPIATISSNLVSFPVTSSGLKWQAILSGNGSQQVQVNSLSLEATADSTAPTNASSLAMLKQAGGASVSSNDWTNGSEPYFSWTAGSDSQSSLRGYCVYVGTDGSADPATTKGLLGTSPVDVSGLNCPFIVSGTNIDFSTPSLRGNPWLTSSTSPYYLSLKAIDNAGNLSPTAASFQFRFDNTAPANPAFITTPSQFVSSKTVTFTWPTTGGNAASDAASGLAGLQYRIGSGGTWYGDVHNGAQNLTDVLANDGSYTTQDPPDFDDLVEGNNNVYVRTWDTAGNVSTAYVTGVIKLNTTSPSSPQNVTATPPTNTANSFAFNWLPPASFAGDQANLTYCYTINTLPSVNSCTFTSAGVTSLGAGAYATQPGENTFYVVAKDEAGNINYATYGSTTFTANTSAPGIPLNVEIADISVKATNNWKLAISWEQPSNVGSGIASYKVYRSTNDITYSIVASNSGASYVDSGLTQQRYYYKIRACDSANNCGAFSTAVDEIPTGRFTTPAELTSEPVLSNISTRRATITWSTSRASDSKIAIGTTPGSYSTDEVSNSQQTTSHSITLANLQSGTTYYYKARWTDTDGNTGSSTEQSFTTLAAPTVKEVGTRKISLNSATIQFTTREAVKAKIYYGKSEGFGGVQQINTSTAESTYTADLSGLEDGAKYFYKINPFDADGNEYEGNIFSLTTPARPQISELRFQPVTGEPTSTQKVTWKTNVPATSLIRYGLVGQAPLERLDSASVKDHEIIIRDLQDNSEYTLTAESRDSDGNTAVSDVQRFRTALDTRPPVLKNLTVETTIRGTGAEARGQVVVSWVTDEPSTSQVAYSEGASGSTYTNRTSEDTTMVTQHTVIVSDLPTSKVFHLQAVSQDRAGNTGDSEDRSTIVGRASDSVLSIIFNALRNVFSFLE
jgi:hypothetical protein